MRIYSTRDFVWKGNSLHKRGGTKPLVSIEQDAKYPIMWRVRMPDGTLSDMVNRTRAKDAAVGVVLRVLNSQESLPVASPVRPNGVALGKVPADKQNAPVNGMYRRC